VLAEFKTLLAAIEASSEATAKAGRDEESTLLEGIQKNVDAIEARAKEITDLEAKGEALVAEAETTKEQLTATEARLAKTREDFPLLRDGTRAGRLALEAALEALAAAQKEHQGLVGPVLEARKELEATQTKLKEVRAEIAQLEK
jgi:chromosome segregation ATPase